MADGDLFVVIHMPCFKKTSLLIFLSTLTNKDQFLKIFSLHITKETMYLL